ncbi:MAG TPA: hypothetical protein VLG69_01245 [Candidatus Andersenbacteria bacterium]|nr:hypothetical protein [Candidatus Andersenbacteria bacterium]
MLQLKVFSLATIGTETFDGSFEAFEAYVNQWLREHPNIELITTTHCLDSDDAPVINLWYREIK